MSCFLPHVVLAGSFDGPDSWGSTFPFCWVAFLISWVGPTILAFSVIGIIALKHIRKNISLRILLVTFVFSLIAWLFVYTVLLAILFALTANFE
jgi:hypothetical protein